MGVVDDDGNVTGVVSARVLLTFLYQNLASFEHLQRLHSVTINESSLGSRQPISIDGTARVIEAFQKMNHCGISSLAVTDRTNALLGNISLVDLKCKKRPSRTHFARQCAKISLHHRRDALLVDTHSQDADRELSATHQVRGRTGKRARQCAELQLRSRVHAWLRGGETRGHKDTSSLDRGRDNKLFDRCRLDCRHFGLVRHKRRRDYKRLRADSMTLAGWTSLRESCDTVACPDVCRFLPAMANAARSFWRGRSSRSSRHGITAFASFAADHLRPACVPGHFGRYQDACGRSAPTFLGLCINQLRCIPGCNFIDLESRTAQSELS